MSISTKKCTGKNSQNFSFNCVTLTFEFHNLKGFMTHYLVIFKNNWYSKVDKDSLRNEGDKNWTLS